MQVSHATDVDARDGRYAVAALGAILAVTVAWWALALWPAPGNPDWLARARLACFNAGPDGLPDASGWMLLVGQPLSMVTFLLLAWPHELWTGLAAVAGRRLGRGALVLSALLLVGGASGAVTRRHTSGCERMSRVCADRPLTCVTRRSDPRAAVVVNGIIDAQGRPSCSVARASRPAPSVAA